MTTPAYQDDAVTVYLGDCLEVLPELADCSVDSVVTDPPYGLDFMGKHWDTGAVAFDTEVWKHCRRVLKPGGHMLAFGGTRTWHRLAAAVEDAGFEIRDSIAWLYSSGFPKSLDVSKAIDRAAGAEREVVGTVDGRSRYDGGNRGAHKPVENLYESGDVVSEATVTVPATDAAKQWQGWGTALKPAFEPVVVARKPLAGTVAGNVLAHGTGALNIDACRVESDGSHKRPFQPTNNERNVYGVQTGFQPTNAAGRWPANVVIDQHTATQIDKKSGYSRDGVAVNRNRNESSKRSMIGPTGHDNRHVRADSGYGGEGGASRFFPTFRYNAKAPGTERPSADGTAHPTVKPLELMRWLIRLVTPPHGLVLDPFAGTGTTAEAAIHEHMRAITIERQPEYLPLITARLHKPMQIGFDYNIGEFDT